MGTLSKDRLIRFKELSWHYFDWLSVLRDAGITEVQDLQGQYLLKCPFHPDKRPSFRIRVHEHNFHCFSCNAYGTVADLMYRLSSLSVSEAQYMDQLLKRTPGMQKELGFSSLFIDSDTLDPGFSGRRKFSAANHIGASLPLSVFSKKVREADDSWESLVFSLTLLQDGESMENVLAQVNRMKNRKANGLSSEIPMLSLEDIISGGEV